MRGKTRFQQVVVRISAGSPSHSRDPCDALFLQMINLYWIRIYAYLRPSRTFRHSHFLTFCPAGTPAGPSHLSRPATLQTCGSAAACRSVRLRRCPVAAASRANLKKVVTRPLFLLLWPPVSAIMPLPTVAEHLGRSATNRFEAGGVGKSRSDHGVPRGERRQNRDPTDGCRPWRKEERQVQGISVVETHSEKLA